MTELPHSFQVQGHVVESPRLTIRPWELSDAEAALSIFGAEEVTRWLAPSVAQITDEAAMRIQLASWIDAAEPPPVGHWAVLDRAEGRLIGSGQIVPLPPENRDLLVGFEIVPDRWGAGFGAEVGHALAHYAFENGLDEIFSVVRTRNERAQAVAERIGMQWVGETDKYFGLRLHVYRLRHSDLDRPVLDTGPIG
ncbi:GNAT family N-acetyltransferase [Microlunatus sp. Gsoil 973]|uniref:GNAT family N-acetyltransferase n=1 Tax=Microlunatus sp. Gsoil 973 TaxID=2672569 RepID=UPI0012B44CC8|nr:GNAT family N-acetyltransferase [Microlunatus sp. Gsoil 973]QGN33218.1 GNAT family N-acetyltransferase [Microlunatus sp. Gsoil 973]